MIISLFLYISFRIIKVCIDQEDQLIKISLCGLTSLLIFQTFIHVGVNTSLIPTTGMTLPFLSYGGSSLIGSAILAGVILNFTKNKYLYLGLKRTRPFKEFLMLKRMHELELPVPRPVSIKLSISGFYYTGKIITEEVLNAVNLKKIIISKKINNQIISNIISVLRNLIQNNIFHSDLNINNILIDESLSIYIIDFDNSFFTKRKTLLIKPLDRLIKSIRKEQENKKLIKSISNLKDEIILS